MKKLLLIVTLMYCFNAFGQAVPTLGVGLEALTLNKGTIDVEVLTKIIMEKQKELKNEALKRFMFKMFPETNYTSRYYVQNCLNILLNEKNPQVIEKEILELTTNYAISLGLTKALITLNDDIVFDVSNLSEAKSVSESKTSIDKSKIQPISYDERIKKLRDTNYKSSKITRLTESIKKVKDSLESAIIGKKYFKSKRYNKKLKRLNSRLFVFKMRNEIQPFISNDGVTTKNVEISFGTKLDIVSLSLSENELIRKKGFFKNKIDFTEEVNLSTFNLDVKKVSIMTRKIDSLIKPYIQNYDIIKAYLNDFEINNFDKNKKSIVNISNQLIDVYFNQFNLSDSEFTSTGLVSIIDEAKNLKEALSLKNNIDYLTNLNLKKSTYSLANSSFENYFEIESTINEINAAISKYNEIVRCIDVLKLNNATVKLTKFEIKKYKIDDFFDTKNNLEEDYKKLENLKNEFKKLSEKLKQNLDTLASTEKDKINDDLNKLKVNIDALIKKNELKNRTSLNEDLSALQKAIENLDSIKDSLLSENNTKIKNLKITIFKSDVFFNEFLKEMIHNVEKKIKINSALSTEEKLIIAATLKELYNKLNYIKNNTKNITLEDINFLENDILKRVFEAKLIDNLQTSSNYDAIINNIKNITPLLKMKIVIDKGLDIKYSKEFVSLFEFIGNLNNLNKAETYTSIIDLLRENSETIIKDLPEGKFKDGYEIFINGMKKYTLINTDEDVEKEYVEIDIVSFLNDLQQYYNRNNPSKFSLYLSVGLNQNLFFNEFTFPDSSEVINSIGFASEKIGVKYKLLDFKKYRGYENVIKSDVYLNKRSPFINDWYVITYGSGLLYALANTSTNQNFNFAHLGFGTGIRFYNALDLNLTIGLPFVKNENFGKNGFIGIGLDIPLGEYLEGLGNK